MAGRVSLVGAGPGDPGLLTVRGRQCLAEADVVIYDNLSNPALLAYARPGAEIVFIPSATTAGHSEYLWKLEQPAHAVANGYFVGTNNRIGRAC